MKAPPNSRFGQRSRPLGLAIATLSGLIFGCGAGVEEPAVEALRPVRSLVVQPAREGRSVALAGVSRPGIESRLSFRVSGTLVELAVDLGDSVRRGQVLARLDPIDFELQLEEAEAAVAEAGAAGRRAQADYERVRLLYEANNAAKSDLDAGRAAAESATAQLEAGSKRIAQARQQLAYTRLTAPFDGAVAAVEVEVNENVSAGQAILRLAGGSQPEVEVAVPEVLIAELAQGQPVTVRFDALPGRDFDARISEVSVAAGGASTYPVVARLEESAAGLRAGMAAEVTFQLAREGEALYVPLVAVGEDQRGRFVFVVEAADGAAQVRRREVEVGEISELGLEISRGLEAGERLVTAGVRRLTDGQRVELQPSEPGR